MLYALICTDHPNSVDVRMANRAEHLAYLDALGDRLKMAGPFLSDDGKPSGSLVVIEATSRDAAQVVAEEDPYARAGLFESVDIRPWNWVVKNPEAA